MLTWTSAFLCKSLRQSLFKAGQAPGLEEKKGTHKSIPFSLSILFGRYEGMGVWLEEMHVVWENQSISKNYLHSR